MLRPVLFWKVWCDRCGADAFDGDDFAAYADRDTAWDAAYDRDWIRTDDGKHFCPDCVEWDEERDIRVPLPPLEAGAVS